ncbi:hypothetical protein KAW65_03115 [candidate division WOR-3 bacterium]|nr:hypothetical protein [candidate division WOR-3 bacterium]
MRNSIVLLLLTPLFISGCKRHEQPTNGSTPNNFTGSWIGFWKSTGTIIIPPGEAWTELYGQGKAISGTLTIAYSGFTPPHYEVKEVSGTSENGIDFELTSVSGNDTMFFAGSLVGDTVKGTSHCSGQENIYEYRLKKGKKMIWDGKAEGELVYSRALLPTTSDTTYINDGWLYAELIETEWGDSVLIGGKTSFWCEIDTFSLNEPAEGKISATDSSLFYFKGELKDTLGHSDWVLFYFSGYLNPSNDSVSGKWYTAEEIGPTPPEWWLRGNGIWNGIRRLAE